jgi:hypothetical protein
MNKIQQKLNIECDLRGIDALITEVRSLRATKERFTKLNSEVEGPNGLRLKASKYEALKQSLDTVKQTFDEGSNNTGQHNPPSFNEPSCDMTHGMNAGSTNWPVQSTGNRGDASAVSGMNPERARLINTTSSKGKPSRDLYEAIRPIINQQRRTGSNMIPLGTRKAQITTNLLAQSNGSVTLKRKETGDSVRHAEKRQRTDNMPPPVTVQSQLGCSDATYASGFSIQPNAVFGVASIPGMHRLGTSWTNGSSLERSRGESLSPSGYHPTGARSLAMDSEWRPRSDFNKPREATTLVAAQSPSSTPRFAMPFVPISTQALVYPPGLTPLTPPFPRPKSAPKMEGVRMNGSERGLLSIPRGIAGNTVVEMEGYPIGLWNCAEIHVAKWTHSEISRLKMGSKIPQELLSYLRGELWKMINMENVHLWNTMPANGNQCILRRGDVCFF